MDEVMWAYTEALKDDAETNRDDGDFYAGMAQGGITAMLFMGKWLQDRGFEEGTSILDALGDIPELEAGDRHEMVMR